jgi:nicotinate-nucleotide--dimethylbenzimidazole phosphoribosyltransferase
MSRPPFDDIRGLVPQLPALDAKAERAIQQRLLASPGKGAHYGDLGPVLARLAAVRGTLDLAVLRPQLTIFAATHGLANPDPQRDANALAALAAGGMPVNFLCGEAGVGLKAFELALDMPTPDIRAADALSERDCAATIAFGMEAVAGDPDVVLLTSIGEGADLAARTAIAAANGDRPEFWADSEPQLAMVLRRIGSAADPLDALRRAGGRDIAALLGAILAARAQRALVILDGLPAIAAAILVQGLDPDAASHCVAAVGTASADQAAAEADDDAYVVALPLPRDVPVIATAGGEAGLGACAVLALAQIKLAAAGLRRAPTAAQLGLDG